MGVTVTVKANFYPNQRKLPTRYTSPPTGVWKAYAAVTGDGSGGLALMSVEMGIEVLSKRIITLEDMQSSGGSAVESWSVVIAILGTGLLDQLPIFISELKGASGNTRQNDRKLPSYLAFGYPIQTIGPGLVLTPINQWYANVNLVSYFLSVWGFWWDNTEPALKR